MGLYPSIFIRCHVNKWCVKAILYKCHIYAMSAKNNFSQWGNYLLSIVDGLSYLIFWQLSEKIEFNKYLIELIMIFFKNKQTHTILKSRPMGLQDCLKDGIPTGVTTRKEKVYYTSLTYSRNLFFLLELQNQF